MMRNARHIANQAWLLRCSLSLLLLLVGIEMSAQLQNDNIVPKINSPLSRFGLGDPVRQYFVASSAMAGLSAAWNDPYHLNMVNPASLGYLEATSFEGGIFVRNSDYTTSDGEDETWGGNLEYLALGFPFRNRVNQALDRKSYDWNLGMSVALMPYTQVGYNLSLIDTLSPGVEQSTNNLKGAGGTSRVRWGVGGRYKQFAFGVEVGFLFGEIINSRLVQFDSLPNSLRAEFLDDFSFRGTTWNLGAQYTYEFKKTNEAGVAVPTGKRLIVGATVSSEVDQTATSTQFIRRFRNFQSDTLVLETLEDNVILPASFSLGVHYQVVNRLNVGVEYGSTNWDSYTNSLKPDQLTASSYVAIGGEFIPNYKSYNSYWERIRYRAGIRLESDPRTLDGQQVESRSITLGFGFPLVMPRQQVSFVNTTVEFGNIGVDNILEENFVRFTFGFTFNDNSWFYKRKFN